MVRIEPLTKALEKMTPEFLSAVHDVFPVDFSIIDADDNVLYWNRHGIRIFKRGPAVIGRNVRMCHPSQSLHKVEKVIEYLKSGERDEIDFWMDLPDNGKPRKVLIRYKAIRDEDGTFLGTLEATINLTPLQTFEGENLLGDFE
ncbi:MAG: PAS domain-containing protein [Candidatus Thorarchaeota archaeon]|nr:PAS domain-containing protein [Candidatus Thorarchaeota archaeon]MCK5238005.1 PAS domain-containing protein [Candidatus Thorarchaeota archaeon]